MTLKEIAQKANVSISTVSRVINKKTQKLPARKYRNASGKSCVKAVIHQIPLPEH